MMELFDIKSFYGKKLSLSLDYLSFSKGELSVLVGKNGSGKTTLLKTILNETYHEGRVLVDGAECEKLSVHERAKKIAFLPQRLFLPSMTVSTLVSHGRFSHMGFGKVLSREDKIAVENAILKCSLEEKKHFLLSELSGGEVQRAYLAMVICQDTPYLLLDEPTTYMDCEHQEALFRILKGLCKEGRGVIFSCHDLPQAFSKADCVTLLSDGKVMASGSPESLCQKEALLHSSLGVGIRPCNETNLLNSYVLTK